MDFNPYTLLFAELLIEEMRKYVDLMEQSITELDRGLEQQVHRLVTKHREDYPHVSKEEEDEIAEWFSDEHWVINQRFPQFLYSSFVVMWYSFIEQTLVNLCRGLDNKNNSLDKIKIFFDKKKNYKMDQTLWQKLNNIRKVRNIIVHRGNRIPIKVKEPEGKCISISREDICRIPGLELLFDDDESFSNTSQGFWILLEDVGNREVYRYMKKWCKDERMQKPKTLLTYNSMSLQITPERDYCQHLVEFGQEIFKDVAAGVGLRTCL